MNGVAVYNSDIEGLIYTSDQKPLKRIKIAIIDLPTRKQITEWYIIENGNDYSAWTDRNPANTGLIFVADGYKTFIASFDSLAVNPDVTLEPSEIPAWMILAVIAAIALIISRKTKAGKLGKIERSDVFTIFLLAGGVIAISVIKKILENLGIWNSQDTKDLDNASTNPNSWWSPTFWQTKPANIPWSYAITESQAEQYARTLYNAFGWLNDNEEQAIGVFRACKTQANASFICWKFQQIYGEDCLKFLRGGWWPQDRLSDADVNEINQFVNRLPKY